MRRLACCFVLALLVGSIAFACSHTRVQDVEVIDPLPAQPFAKLLVLGIHEDGRIRRLFENAFVAELAAENVVGVQSYKFIYEERAINVQNVLRALQESDADSLVTVRAMNAGTGTPRIARREGSAVFDLHPLSGDQSLVSRGTQVTLQTNVYEASSKRLVLSATSQAVRPESVEDLGHEICRVTVTSLAREKLLKKP
jgi:hypothetical protein